MAKSKRSEPIVVSLAEREELRRFLLTRMEISDDGCWFWKRSPARNPLVTVFGMTTRVRTLVFWAVTGRMPYGYLMMECAKANRLRGEARYCVCPAHGLDRQKDNLRRDATPLPKTCLAARWFIKGEKAIEDEDLGEELIESVQDAKARIWPLIDVKLDGCWIYGEKIKELSFRDQTGRLAFAKLITGKSYDKIKSSCSEESCLRFTHLLVVNEDAEKHFPRSEFHEKAMLKERGFAVPEDQEIEAPDLTQL